MQLNQQTDYALRVLMLLAGEAEQARQAGRPDEPRLMTIREIAEFHAISRNHLMKVVNTLVEHGYVLAQRGRGGGLRLGMPSGQVRIGDVVRAMEGNWRLVECFDATRNNCRVRTHCGLQHVFQKALLAFWAVLDQYTLADITPSGSADEISISLSSLTRRHSDPT